VSSPGESIRWYPRVRVERYSIDQTWWAQCRLGKRHLHGDVLRKLFTGPEDGYAFDEGNQMTDGGLTNITSLVTGRRGLPLIPGRMVIGLGTDGTTPFDGSQSTLAAATGEGPESSWYQPMDVGYPELIARRVISGQATIAGDVANWPWLEWCWVVGEAAPSPGSLLPAVYEAGAALMLNRKIPENGLGAKQQGAAWVFQATVSFSSGPHA
jgi:hypothetical protein